MRSSSNDRKTEESRVTYQRALACVASVALFMGVHAASANGGHGDPFAFFRSVIVLDAADRERLDRDDVIVHVLPSRDGELGVFAASRLDAPAESLVAWT